MATNADGGRCLKNDNASASSASLAAACTSAERRRVNTPGIRTNISTVLGREREARMREKGVAANGSIMTTRDATRHSFCSV